MKSKVLSGFLIALCAALCLTVVSINVHAQAATPAQATSDEDEINLDTQLYLIVGTNQDVADAKLPASLDPVIKQLRASMPFKNYRLEATLMNRVKNGGRLDVKWLGGRFEASPSAEAETKSSNNHLQIRLVKLFQSTEGQQKVQMQGFNFIARVPVPVTSVATTGAMFPTFNYETTSLATDISMTESTPVIVGTLNVNPSGDAIILVVTAQRTQK
jgi:hypothetical protein